METDLMERVASWPIETLSTIAFSLLMVYLVILALIALFKK